MVFYISSKNIYEKGKGAPNGLDIWVDLVRSVPRPLPPLLTGSWKPVSQIVCANSETCFFSIHFVFVFLLPDRDFELNVCPWAIVRVPIYILICIYIYTSYVCSTHKVPLYLHFVCGFMHFQRSTTACAFHHLVSSRLDSMCLVFGVWESCWPSKQRQQLLVKCGALGWREVETPQLHKQRPHPFEWLPSIAKCCMQFMKFISSSHCRIDPLLSRSLFLPLCSRCGRVSSRTFHTHRLTGLTLPTTTTASAQRAPSSIWTDRKKRTPLCVHNRDYWHM